MQQYRTTEVSDRRSDLLLRTVVACCQRGLSERGFQLHARGSRDSFTWVQFACPARAPDGQSGALLLLLAHDSHERALLMETRFADTELEIHTPRQKQVHRYDRGANVW